MSNGKLKVNDRILAAVFFHKPEEPYGWLSNWAPSEFILDGVKYSSVEQYIMHQKCVLFGDVEAAEQVMKTNDPAKQQAIARGAHGYIENVWNGQRQMIGEKGLHAKFYQNPDLRKKLLDTGDAWLVECANSDKIWACGVGLYQDGKEDVSKWKGTNILGFALMKVREELKNE